MDKIYDKLFLAVAVLLLLGAVGFYMMKSREISAVTPQVGQPADHPYQAIPVPTSVELTAIWPDAVEQAPGELYDVFTPPAIYIDDAGNFVFESPIKPPPPPPPPFGLYLAKFERNLYRIQLEGYIEEDLSDPSKSLLLLFDEEKQVPVRARVGEEKASSGFTLVNFSIDRLRDINGNISKNAIATLLDHRSGRKMILKRGERLYDDTNTIILRSKQDPTVEIEITEVPQTFETPAGTYILEKINLEDSSVIVKKLGNGEFEPQTKQLFLNVSNSINNNYQKQ